MTFDKIKNIIRKNIISNAFLRWGVFNVDSLWMYPDKTIVFPDFRHRHHLPPFGHNASETTNMSDREETKGSAPGVGTPHRLNRLEVSTFSRVNCSRHQFDQFDHFFFSPSSTPNSIDLSYEQTPVDNQAGTTVEKKLSGSRRCWQISTTTLSRRSIIVEQTVVDKKGTTRG